MTGLADILRARIRAEGPLPISWYMQDALLHPEYGYYMQETPFGREGDFITAPEISQMFGELIGLMLAQYWLDTGAPEAFNLVELGPGRGTLMADLLRATKGVRGFHEAASIHLVEASPGLRSRQIQAVSTQVAHHSMLSDVPEGPLFLVANEFFDALPIRQFVRYGEGWREKCVGLQNDQLVFGLSDPTCPAFLMHRLADTRDGDLVERSESGENFAGQIGARIATHGGIGLIMDYGDWRSLGDTLQAVRNHTPEPPLANPGKADLTAHIDFEALATAAAPAQTTRLTPQGVFLERLGITQRANALAARLKDESLRQHIAAHRRLTHPDEMGTVFKAMAILKPDAPVPAGFV